MVNLDRKKLLCISVIIILVGSIAASVWVGMPKNSRLIGIAYFGDPVAGGTLTVYDLNGNRLFEAQDATMSNGVFILNVGWTWLWNIPKEFKVSITGGTLNDTPFTDTITRYIQNYDPNNYYTVNSITTLLAAYKDNNPSLNDADIENSVATFLDIPSTTSLQNVIDNAYYTRLFFDETVFSEESKTNGGFSSFVNGLLGEIEQGKTHSFAGETLLSGGGGSLFSMAAGEIGKGALSYVGGEAMGWVMNKLGYKSAEDKKHEQIMNELAAMSAQLQQINQQLDMVMRDLEQISSQLSAIKTAMKNMEIELKKYMGQVNSYDPLAKIDNAYSSLVIYSKCAPGDVSSATIEEWAAAVLNPTTGIGYAINLLDKFNMGNALENEEGLLQILTDQLTAQLNQQARYRYGSEYRNNIYAVYQSLTDYFQKVLYYELKGLALLSEAHHARNETSPVAYYIENAWQPMINNQVKLYTSLVERIVVSLFDKLEFPNMGPLPANTPREYLAFYQKYHNNQLPPTVARIFPEADRFADQLLNGTGKFIVRVVYESISIPDLTPVDPKPVFVNMDTGKEYSVNGVLHSIPVIDRAGVVFYYRTYDFGVLPAGNYKLVSPTTMEVRAGIVKDSTNGWMNSAASGVTDYWSFKEGLDISKYGYLPISISRLSNVASIQVVNDQDGHPYGYWGGTWFDKSIERGLR